MRSGELREQEREQGSQQRFPSSSHVVHQLKEAPIAWHGVWCNASMRTQPGSPQGPKAFQRVDVSCMQALPVVIPRICATTVPDACMRVAPLCQAALNVVRICVNTG